MDCHAHTSRAEVMGLLGGTLAGNTLSVAGYRRAAAASSDTHCDMDPVSQALASERLSARGLAVCGWHHSHPEFAASPSARDLATQQSLQAALERARRPLVAAITALHWPRGRTMTLYKFFRVESTPSEPTVGYQLSVKLVPDVTSSSLPALIADLREMCGERGGPLSVEVARDVCPLAGCTYLEKCISSVSHHMRSAGYADDDPVTQQLILGIRDIFR